jgi:hypothetical protein
MIVEFGPKRRRDLSLINIKVPVTLREVSLASSPHPKGCKDLFPVLTISCQTDVFAVSYCYPGIRRSCSKDTAQIECFIFLALEILVHRNGIERTQCFPRNPCLSLAGAHRVSFLTTWAIKFLRYSFTIHGSQSGSILPADIIAAKEPFPGWGSGECRLAVDLHMMDSLPIHTG